MEARTEPEKPRLLFVDDEQRVLNSMRIMFRRKFDLYLASHGAEALDIVRDRNIDVIVADHRMPQMTGVEVLTKVRKLSPRTVRILLTGYADLDAVEGSINDGEVFRFLTKPCGPKQLRDTVELAARLARTTPPPPTTEVDDEDGLEIVLESDTATEIHSRDGETVSNPIRMPPLVGAAEGGYTQTTVIERPHLTPDGGAAVSATPAPGFCRAGLGVIVFSSDEGMIETVQQAVRGRLPVYRASNVVHVVRTLKEHGPGVLITDVSTDKATIQAMTARLKQHLPELVTIAVSPHRDVLDMVWLINHGQIFRFLRKPLSPGRCAVSLQAALHHHRALLKNPTLVKRHEVDATADASGIMDGMLSRLKSLGRLWAQA